jgi:hypothetical protein
MRDTTKKSYSLKDRLATRMENRWNIKRLRIRIDKSHWTSCELWCLRHPDPKYLYRSQSYRRRLFQDDGLIIMGWNEAHCVVECLSLSASTKNTAKWTSSYCYNWFGLGYIELRWNVKWLASELVRIRDCSPSDAAWAAHRALSPHLLTEKWVDLHLDPALLDDQADMVAG